MAMFDHFYIGDGEWSIDAEGYAPGYGEALTGAGGVALSVRKVKELARKVLCVDAGEGCAPVNDPICNTADVTINTVFVEGELFIRVDVLSSFGFEVLRIDWSKDNVAQTPVGVGGVPGPYALGPVNVGDSVQITFVNAQDPLCNDVRAAFVVEQPACTGLQITVTDENDAGIALRGSDGFVTAISPSGLFNTYANDDATISLDEQGVWCVYPSDSDGNASGTYLEMAMGFTGVAPVDFSPMDGSGPLSALFTNGFEVSGVNWTELTLPTLLGSNARLVMQGPLPNLATINNPSGSKFASMQIEGPSLTSASIDVLCNALDATATGQVSTFVGTAAATAASLANRNAYIANGNALTFSA
jgi:hypothetical protein